ncbi:MAG: tetratricopeptide repeat protein [Acidobacteriota bacterium]
MFALGALLTALLLAPSADDLADGLKALDAKQPAVAEPLLRKAVEADPKDYGAHFNLALALSLQNKDPEAISELRQTLELKPGLYEADLNLGILLLRNKQAAEALPVLKEAADARPKEARPNLYYAQALFDSGDAAQSERRYAAVVEADPKSAAAQLGLARAQLKQEKLPEAAGHFRAAGYQDGLLDVAAAYEKAGMKAEAIGIYREFPENAAVRQRLGQLLIDNKDAAGAIPNLEEAVRKAPSTANRLALADAYKLAKENAKMLEQLQLATAADPNNHDLRMAYGRSLRDERKLIPAAQQFLAATKLRPDSVAAWNELASALIVNENYAEGLAALDRIRAMGKEIPGDYFLRAITLDRLKMKPQAVAAYRQFLAADDGAHPDQEFQSRQRMRIIENELKKK